MSEAGAMLCNAYGSIRSKLRENSKDLCKRDFLEQDKKNL